MVQVVPYVSPSYPHRVTLLDTSTWQLIAFTGRFVVVWYKAMVTFLGATKSRSGSAHGAGDLKFRAWYVVFRCPQSYAVNATVPSGIRAIHSASIQAIMIAILQESLFSSFCGRVVDQPVKRKRAF